jgi:hypothetical protein
MKAKLIKQNGIGIQTIDGIDYYLILDGKTYHTNPLTSDLSNGGKSSKQNGDEIFGVVDVEKLAIEYDLYEKINFVGQTRAYKAGFQKAMELNKDKVFTLEDMMNCWNKALTFQDHKELFGYHIQSLQQPTEIEVEIIMRNSRTGNIVKHDSDLEWDEDGLCDRAISKLDSEGCLILKINKPE